jgi:hypothetical protein
MAKQKSVFRVHLSLLKVLGPVGAHEVLQVVKRSTAGKSPTRRANNLSKKELFGGVNSPWSATEPGESPWSGTLVTFRDC